MKILQKFKLHLTTLYSSDSELDASKANDFFSHISLPSLSKTQLEMMEESVSVGEVSNAIKELKLNK